MRHPALLDVVAPFPLWLADLSESPTHLSLAWLSEFEKARASRFVFDTDRNIYLAAHVALRRLLADATGISPERQEFEVGPLGRPRLSGAEGLHFSLSYAGQQGLIGIARGNSIGVDAEALRAVEDREALAEGLFTKMERAEPVEGCADTHFLRGWTAKEACMKAIGTGLSTPPISFETGFPRTRIKTTIAAQGANSTLEVETFTLDTAIIGKTIIAAWARTVADDAH